MKEATSFEKNVLFLFSFPLLFKKRISLISLCFLFVQICVENSENNKLDIFTVFFTNI